MLNINMTFGGMGVVDLDIRIVAKYFSDFNMKQLYHI